MNNANNGTVIKAGQIVPGDAIDFGDGHARYIFEVPERLKTVIKVTFHSGFGGCIVTKTFKATAKVTRY